MKISPQDYDVTTRWSEADQAFLASVAELPGIMAGAPNRAEAALQIVQTLEFALAATAELAHSLA